MRTITVSTDVFARIWASRGPGEETEDAILNRLLSGRAEGDDAGPNPPPAEMQRSSAEMVGGIRDRRFGVTFPEGFEIFRTYLGTDFRAQVRGGRWMLSHNGQECGTLNELSQAIGTKTENAWANWLYRTSTGAANPVSKLRDQGKITRRKSWERELGMPE